MRSCLHFRSLRSSQRSRANLSSSWLHRDERPRVWWRLLFAQFPIVLFPLPPPLFFFSLFFDPACYYKIFDRWSGVAARLDILRSVNWKNWETTSDESGKECRWMDITDFKSFFLQLLLLNYSPRLFVRSASASNEILEFSHRSLASFDEIRFVARKTRSLRLQSSSKISTTFLPSID